MTAEKMSAGEVLEVLMRRAAECRSNAIVAEKRTERPSVAKGWYESEEETLAARAAVAAMAERANALESRLAALIAENEALRGIADAAKVYFDGWVQDEADDEGIHWTGCSESQHKAARNLKLALAARTEPRHG